MSRQDLPEPLSGVPEKPEIELAPGLPWITVPELNRLIRRHRLAPTLAKTWVLDQLAMRVELDLELEQQLLLAEAQRLGFDPKAEQALADWLDQQPIPEPDLLARATGPARWRRWQSHRFGDEIEIRFLERKNELDRVSYSLLRVKEREQAEELYQQIKEGESSFAALSQQFSEGSERQSQGLIGPVPLASGHPDLVSRLRVSTPGQLWEPFFVVNIWLVVRLEQRWPAQLNEAMREQMMGELFQGWLDQQVKELLQGQQPQLPERMPR